MWAIAAVAFGAIFFWGAPFPLIVALAALTGWWGAGRFVPAPKPGGGQAVFPAGGVASSTRGGWQRVAGTLALGLALWWAPVAVAGLTLGWDGVLVKEGVFFSKAAMVTFGGAYAVLPYVTSHAVEHHQWLTAAQMMDGLGLAETTPGPLIMVLQFVGFLGVHVFFPAAGVVDWFAVAVAVAAFVALQFFKVGMIPVVLLSGVAGWLWSL
jgi:chromate transporter